MLGDSNYLPRPLQWLDPRKTVFVGALHGMLNAEGLATIFGDLFGGKGRYKKKNVFLLETFPKSVYPPTHPRVFVSFGKTKGEIWVKKGDFWGDLGVF